MIRASLLALALFALGSTRAQVADLDHGQYSRADIEAGQRLYSVQCQVCHGANGDSIPGIDLKFGKFRRVSSDEDIVRTVTTGIPGVGMPAFVFQPPQLTAIVAFIRAGFDPGSAAVRVGSAEHGREVFEGKGQCATCHRVNGRGPRTAPDLSDIGSLRTLAALQRSVLEPDAALQPIHRPVHIVTKGGEDVRGRRLNEDTLTVQLIDEHERLRSFDKADLRQYTVETKATMPSFKDRLNANEVADLVAYLASLKGL
ncbi:MAG TPA: c-type cytochrome [Gammaproteobacteria bacterium]|jgi:putative heme-binding domain-containing protein|nr:c-type cytochrome [Gammaproteobacteria bacterium]